MTTEIKGLGATITYDGETITIKHRMMGTVTVPIALVMGCELDEPRLLSMGKFRIVTTAARTKGMMPKEPLVVPFAKRQLPEFVALHETVVAAMGGYPNRQG
jgi:hypothetical protein